MARKRAVASVETKKPDDVGSVYDRSSEYVDVETLTPHPRNYRSHPESQLLHIEASLRDFGFYRNVVVARDGTILAGHGVVTAAMRIGIRKIPIVRLDLSPLEPRALKVLALDNELGRFAEDDDRALTEILREVGKSDGVGLVGTGYDERMLAALVMVTRPASEIASSSAATEWVGMPEYQETDGEIFQLVVSFESEKDRKKFVDQKAIKVSRTCNGTWSAWWPEREAEDASSLRFEESTSPARARDVAKKAKKQRVAS